MAKHLEVISRKREGGKTIDRLECGHEVTHEGDAYGQHSPWQVCPYCVPGIW